MDRSYLGRVGDAYAAFFHQYNRSPLLIVNAAEIDPIDNEKDFRQLVAEIERTRGRRYFNPTPSESAP